MSVVSMTLFFARSAPAVERKDDSNLQMSFPRCLLQLVGERSQVPARHERSRAALLREVRARAMSLRCRDNSHWLGDLRHTWLYSPRPMPQ
jgi:hypothetical protein